MKRLFILFFICVSIFQSFGQNYTPNTPQITEDVVEQLKTMFLKEQYKDCIDSCNHYLRNYHYFGYEKHPYRDWTNNFFRPVRIDELTDVLYWGTMSAYKYSLSVFDRESIFLGMEWSRACANICSDYLKEETPEDYWSEEKMTRYILFGVKGIEVTQSGDHFLCIMGDDKWAKKEAKWFDKTGDIIYETLQKKLSGFENKYSEYPLLQYQITNICTAPSLNKKVLRQYKEVFNRRLAALTNLIKQNQNNNFDLQIHVALNSLTTMLTHSVIEGEICKKVGSDYERFCMENLIKLQDVSFCLSGSSRYSMNPSYTLQDIQNSLEETDCAIIHFEAPVASGHYYSRHDLGTLYRNYALIITKNQVTPDVWHSGYINDNKVNDLSVIKETYPNAKRFFYVGTPRMSAFMDIVGTDSSIVRLHSLSQLLRKCEEMPVAPHITFVGDINYHKGEHSMETAKNKGAIVDEEKFDSLIGPKIELDRLIELFGNNHIRFIGGDNATRNIVASEISRSCDIFQISTHGIHFNSDNILSPEDLILKKDFLDNSRLILSGYNDSPNSKMTSISASDVLKIKKINTYIVFLDACSSGRGALSAYGAVGMAEAFHLIGAQNIICYLEPVEDRIATQFSNSFYTELSKGTSCHDAFFKAKKSINHQIKVVLWE